MRYLLDTHTLLWVVADDPKVTKKVKKLFLDSENEFFVSIASLWEMAIKTSLKKLILKESLETFTHNHITQNDIKFLRIEPPHVFRLEQLPFHHRDPFDRLIISQAIEDNLTIVGSDKKFDKYSIKRLW